MDILLGVVLDPISSSSQNERINKDVTQEQLKIVVNKFFKEDFLVKYAEEYLSKDGDTLPE